MSISKKRLRPPYSQIVISDPTAEIVVPPWQHAVPFVATDTCVLFACLAETDGETEFKLGYANEIDPGTAPLFDGLLRTPNRTIALDTVEGDRVLDMQTRQTETRVRIWSNRVNQPDEIAVGID